MKKWNCSAMLWYHLGIVEAENAEEARKKAREIAKKCDRYVTDHLSGVEVEEESD